MDTRLRYLPISEVVAGMVLGAPLTLVEHGRKTFALPSGHSLTEENLRQIAVHHGEFACIEVPELRSEAEIAEQVRQATEKLDRIFARADRSQPQIEGLYQAVLRYRSL
ncbi:hypothetical protein [Azonexus sp. IMCC34839]|uniref:hypothetical protein n=1 Tax=Azonexus sp. IMCC34839 TaxID=3133695 RepID=UPI003999F029